MESAVCPSRLKKRNIWEADNKVTPSSVVLRLYQECCVRCGPKFSTFMSSRMDTLVQIRSNFAYFLLVYRFFLHFSYVVLGFIKIIFFSNQWCILTIFTPVPFISLVYISCYTPSFPKSPFYFHTLCICLYTSLNTHKLNMLFFSVAFLLNMISPTYTNISANSIISFF